MVEEMEAVGRVEVAMGEVAMEVDLEGVATVVATAEEVKVVEETGVAMVVVDSEACA